MSTMSAAPSLDIDEVVSELTQGAGFVVLEDFYDAETIAEARSELYRLAESEEQKVFHFVPEEARATQKRVWNLIDKGEVFRRVSMDPRLGEILAKILGSDFAMSSFAANVLYPGAPAQEAHVDYPYWDLYDRERWPQNVEGTYILQVETAIMLDDFTAENGATGLQPATRQRGAWPDKEEFAREMTRATGPAGSLCIFAGLTWHAAQANNSDASRAALLGSYTCKWVKPIEDYIRGLSPETEAALTPTERGILGLDYPYPAVMDEQEARNAEGETKAPSM